MRDIYLHTEFEWKTNVVCICRKSSKLTGSQLSNIFTYMKELNHKENQSALEGTTTVSGALFKGMWAISL